MSPTGTQSAPTESPAAAGGDAPSTSADRGTESPATHDIDQQIDALLSGPATTVAASQTEPDTSARAHVDDSPSAQAEAAVASIEKQVESLVDQFVETQTAPQPSAPEPEPLPTPSSIGELDDQLARLTDELLTLPDAAPSEPAPPKAEVSAPSVHVAAAQATPSPSPEPSQTAAESPATVLAQPAPAASVPQAPVVRPARPGRLLLLCAKPLAGKPRLVRETVGWMGVNTIFLAVVVWAYHLWLQKPEKAVANHAPSGLVTSDAHDAHASDHSAPAANKAAHADGHAAAPHDPHSTHPGDSKDSHGDAAPAHAAGQATGHTAKPEAEHADPITGAAPLHKKKPSYALSNVMAERLNAGKKKADDGHGAKKKDAGHGAPAKSGH